MESWNVNKLRLLVVEDDPDQRDLIRETLVVPAGYMPGAPLRFRIDVRDAAGRPLSFDHGASTALRVATDTQ